MIPVFGSAGGAFAMDGMLLVSSGCGAWKFLEVRRCLRSLVGLYFGGIFAGNPGVSRRYCDYSIGVWANF